MGLATINKDSTSIANNLITIMIIAENFIPIFSNLFFLLGGVNFFFFFGHFGPII